MIRRTIFSALAVAASVGTALIVKTLLKKDEAKEENDDEVRFITITDDDEPKMYDASDRSEEVRKVCAVYPYLDPDFVETVLDKNDSLNTAYEEDTLITLEHSVSFKDTASKEKFTDILESSGYSCEGNNGNVTAKKKLFTEDGAIVSDILNVANQAAVLNGIYKDYDVYQ
jgi:hypothetical protein